MGLVYWTTILFSSVLLTHSLGKARRSSVLTYLFSRRRPRPRYVRASIGSFPLSGAVYLTSSCFRFLFQPLNGSVANVFATACNGPFCRLVSDHLPFLSPLILPLITLLWEKGPLLLIPWRAWPTESVLPRPFLFSRKDGPETTRLLSPLPISERLSGFTVPDSSSPAPQSSHVSILEGRLFAIVPPSRSWKDWPLTRHGSYSDLTYGRLLCHSQF